MPDSKILVVDCGESSKYIKSHLQQSPETDWNVEFVPNGTEALQAMEKNSYQVLISDMVMPEMNGLDFFKQVKDKHPSTLRILESTNEERGFLIAASELAHVVLSPDCGANTFHDIIDNTMKLQQIITNKDVLEKLTSIKTLPSPPEVYNELVNELKRDECSMHKVAEIIQKDIAITAKLLQMINSAFFGLKTHVESPIHAVNLLGINTVKSIVLSSGIFNTIKEKEVAGFSVDDVYRRSMAVGTAARHLANVFGMRTKEIEDALMAGLLHDIGKLLMITNFKDELKHAKQMAEEQKLSFSDAVRQSMGVNHAELGAHLLSLWNLPLSILEAVAYHEKPVKTTYRDVNIITAVHLAYGIITDNAENIRKEEDSYLDFEYLERLGLRGNLEQFKQFCLAALDE